MSDGGEDSHHTVDSVTRMDNLNESLISGRVMNTPQSTAKQQQYSHHDGSWGVYIGNKRRKIESQFEEKYSLQSNIFENCIIWINGRTRVMFSQFFYKFFMNF